MPDATKWGFDLGVLATELRQAAAFVATNSWQGPKVPRILISGRKSQLSSETDSSTSQNDSAIQTRELANQDAGSGD
jgi:hypothetical protein